MYNSRKKPFKMAQLNARQKIWSLYVGNNFKAWQTLAEKAKEDTGAYNIKYLRFQEEQGEDDPIGQTHLRGMIVFDKLMTPSLINKWKKTNEVPQTAYEPGKDPYALYEYTHKKDTKVPDGIEIEIGYFKITKNGKKNRMNGDADDDKITHQDVWDYFKDGGDIDNIPNVLGPKVCALPVDKIKQMYLKTLDYEGRERRKLEAIDWFKEDAKMWQVKMKEIIDAAMENKQDRTVFCVIGNKGKNGKTCFSKQMQYLNPGKRAWLQEGKIADMARILTQKDDLEFVSINMCRGDENFTNPRILEMMVDGIIQSGKYESCVREFYHPIQCLMLSNHHLPWHKLSEDRWEIYELDGTIDEETGEEPSLKKWSREQISFAWQRSVELDEEDKTARRRRDPKMDDDARRDFMQRGRPEFDASQYIVEVNKINGAMKRKAAKDIRDKKKEEKKRMKLKDYDPIENYCNTASDISDGDFDYGSDTCQSP